MIKVDSFVEPLGRFPILPYLVQTLRFVIALKLTEDEADNLDVWLAPAEAHESNERGHIRLCFMVGDRVLCRIPYQTLVRAEASFLSRAN